MALGTKVTVFDITEAKREDALRLGAEKYVNVTRPEELEGPANTFDFILSTIPAPYDPDMITLISRSATSTTTKWHFDK